MPVLYSCTELLKKRRAAASLFSMSESSVCSCWKFALALRSGIGLGQREQAAQRAGQLAFGGGDLRRPLRGKRRVARLHHVFERAALVAGVAFDRLDQVRDQVVPLLQLHVDIGKGLVDPLSHGDEAVVDAENPEGEDDKDTEDDPAGRHG